MSNNKPYTEDEPELKKVAIWVCELCLSRKGGECHSPGCTFWMHEDPNLHSGQYEILESAHTQPKEQQPTPNIEKEIDVIMEDCAVGHNFDYAGRALKELFAKQQPTASVSVDELVDDYVETLAAKLSAITLDLDAKHITDAEAIKRHKAVEAEAKQKLAAIIRYAQPPDHSGCLSRSEVAAAIGEDETGGYGRGVQPVRNRFRQVIRRRLGLSGTQEKEGDRE